MQEYLTFQQPIFESEYKIVNTYLQLSTSTENQGKVDEYADELLQKQQSQEKVIPLFAVEVLSDVSLSAGLGESLFEEYETETVYALSWNDSVYIKKLYREENGFRMVSLNGNYSDKWIPYCEDNPRIVELVVSHFMPVIGA